MNDQFIYFADKEIEEEIGRLEQDAVIAWWSEGRWNLHDLLGWLLNQTGPADVWLSTFTISEAALRSIAWATELGMIRQLHCLLDNNVSRHKLRLLLFAGNMATEVKLTNNHSKLILIENDEWKVSVVGSANMTPNPRKEAGVIFSKKDIFNKYKVHLADAMQKGIDIAVIYDNN